jgi:hypothetical protein
MINPEDDRWWKWFRTHFGLPELEVVPEDYLAPELEAVAEHSPPPASLEAVAEHLLPTV